MMRLHCIVLFKLAAFIVQGTNLFSSFYYQHLTSSFYCPVIDCPLELEMYLLVLAIINQIMIKLDVTHQHHGLTSKLSVDYNSQSTQLQSQICKPSSSKHVQNQQLPTGNKNGGGKDREGDVILHIQATQKKVKKDLQELIDQYKCEAEKMMVNHGYDPEKEAAIREQLGKLQKEKKSRREKFQKDLKKMENKQAQLEKDESKRPEQLEEKRRSIEKRIELIHERQRKRQQQQSNFIKFYHEYKAAKPKYLLLEEQFKQKQQTQNQSKIRRLKQKVQQTYKPMDLQSLQEFQDQYMNRKYQAEKGRLQNQLYQKKQQEANFIKLNQLYKGRGHSNIREEREERVARSKEAQEKYRRIRDYSQVVKEEYRPRVRSSVDTEQEERQIDSSQMPQTQRGQRLVKQRFLKGQYQGKMVEYKKIPLSYNQQITKGIQYLEYLKSLPKRKKKDSQTIPLPKKVKKPAVFYVDRQENPLYRGRKYNSIDLGHLESRDSVQRVMEFMRYRKGELESQEKLLRNRNYRNRNQWEQQHRDYNTNLVGNIEQKLQLLKKL